MQPQIRYCRSADGVNIAYTATGSGPPVVLFGFCQVERDWNHPGWQRLLRPLEAGHRVVRFDERGTGLSDRDISDFSLDARVWDLEAVIGAASIDQCSLVGFSQGVTTAIGYALRHPAQVSRMALYGGAVSPTYRRLDAQVRGAMLAAMRAEWGMGAAAYAHALMYGASAEEVERFQTEQVLLTTGDVMARYLELNLDLDLRAELPRLDMPCLVLQRRHDRAIPFENAREIAAGIPGARVVALTGSVHVPFAGDVEELANALVDFLIPEDAQPPAGAPPAPRGSRLSERETEVLRLLAVGRTNQQIADELVISAHTVARHVSSIFAKTGATNRTEAASFAREAPGRQ